MTELAPGREGAMGRERFAKPLFLATIFTGSFLLFLTQPMIARMALPRLGGAPAVWNSAMLVYQALLLAGYAYAHYLAGLRPRRQAGIHLALFAGAALWLPIGLSEALPPADVAPALWAPWFLISSMGPLFFIVSAQAPLMQRWYALETARGEPYALYAFSNLGSFAGLISYPLVVEPRLTLDQQSLLWSSGYALLVLLVVGCAFTIPAHAVEAAPVEETPAPPRSRVLHWIALAAVPSGLMLSTTTHLTTDIVAVPLLWVVPLGLYLLSFVVAFAGRRGPANFFTAVAPLVLLIAGGFGFSDGSDQPVLSASLGLLLLLVLAIALHSEMYRLRPAPSHLTAFYLAMAAGGVLGGIFCALVAPTLFDWAYEHPLLLVGAALLLPQAPLIDWADRIGRWRLILPILAILISLVSDRGLGLDLPQLVSIAGSVAIALMAVILIGRPLLFAACFAALMMSYGGWRTLELTLSDARTRSYFGIYAVQDDLSDSPARMLTHGTTLHGLQNLTPGQETLPTTYYAPKSAVGLTMRAAETLYGPAARIGVIGLGTGTLSCYARPGQDWRFFEIDPSMVEMARESGRFTFLSSCAPQAKIVVGDARLSMARQPAGQFQILAVDAFSSDAVPMHLLTREALRVYGRAMQPDGILLFHISNRYLDLGPVIGAAAAEEGWDALLFDYNPTAKERAQNAAVSIWIVMSRRTEKLEQLIAASGSDAWQKLMFRADIEPWTDDYASILPVIRGWGSE